MGAITAKNGFFAKFFFCPLFYLMNSFLLMTMNTTIEFLTTFKLYGNNIQFGIVMLTPS
jgi:hypothetical protein